MKNIPFFSLKEQTTALRRDLDKTWKRVTKHGVYVLGGEVSLFEKNFAKFVGSKYAVGTSSGTDALMLAVRALELKDDDEVIVPSNSYIATALAVSFGGGRLVFADVDPETMLLDLKNVQKVWSEKTRAVIPVHLYGQSVDIKPILDWCKSHNAYVIEDVAQAHGASYNGIRCGTAGHFGCFSFYPSKNLGAFGDAGAVTIDDEELYTKLIALRNYGSIKRFDHYMKGSNQRLDAIQAGILNTKLTKLNGWNRKRIKIAQRYDRKLSSIDEVQLLPSRKGAVSVYHLYVIRTDRRDELRSFLSQHHIETGIHYPVPIHLQKAYAELSHQKGDFPVSEESAKRLVSLPMYPEMSLKAVDRISEVIHAFFKGPTVSKTKR